MSIDLRTPPNTIARIDRVWMYVSQDAAGNEGVCAATLDPTLGPIPLIAADEARLKQLGPIAEELARLSGIRIVLIELSTRRDVRTIDGGH